MTATLSLGNLCFDPPKEAPPLAAPSIARRRHILQSQVNPDLLFRSHVFFYEYRHRQAEPTVPNRILCKAALLPLYPFEALRLEDPKALPTESHRTAFALHACRFKRNPSERASRTAARAPAQSDSLSGSALLRILAVDALDGIRADPLKMLRGAGRKVVEVKSSKPLTLTGAGPGSLLI